MLNSNMRCIEIVINFDWMFENTGWTVTWDVLKYRILCIFWKVFISWTVTWDVLKYTSYVTVKRYRICWTVTWDVLKY